MGQAQVKVYDEWWQEPNRGDQSMEDEHQFFWQDCLENMIDVDLSGKKILDFGCSQGGFLRYIYKDHPFKSAVGIDLAQKSIDKANQIKGNIPAQFFALDNLETLDKDFDCAISTAVLFLIDDIKDHAKQIYDRLKPGGIYIAQYPDYVTNPAYAPCRDVIDEFAAQKCAPKSLEEIVSDFESAGFQVFLKRIIPKGYISVGSESRFYGNSVPNIIEFWYNHRYAFKCVKPA